jgi:putative ABC transport system substrate-binding protein
MVKERPEALLVFADRVFLHNRVRIMDFATKHRLPGVHAYRELVEVGGLMSFGPNYAGMHRRAAYYVDRILKGAKPSDLPVERPRTFELVINLKTAKALGLTIPPSLLQRADQVMSSGPMAARCSSPARVRPPGPSRQSSTVVVAQTMEALR